MKINPYSSEYKKLCSWSISETLCFASNNWQVSNIFLMRHSHMDFYILSYSYVLHISLRTFPCKLPSFRWFLVHISSLNCILLETLSNLITPPQFSTLYIVIQMSVQCVQFLSVSSHTCILALLCFLVSEYLLALLVLWSTIGIKEIVVVAFRSSHFRGFYLLPLLDLTSLGFVGSRP